MVVRYSSSKLGFSLILSLYCKVWSPLWNTFTGLHFETLFFSKYVSHWIKKVDLLCIRYKFVGGGQRDDSFNLSCWTILQRPHILQRERERDSNQRLLIFHHDPEINQYMVTFATLGRLSWSPERCGLSCFLETISSAYDQRH